MSKPISLLDVIKQGGYEASLITTFNASLPFYEEVVLRRLVAAGCKQNIVLMDHAQCAGCWESEAARPRLAGAAYILLPVKVPGAFHPKVCILVGKKKATILIGSHNLTLSGFGYNREVTNWVQVSGKDDKEGITLLGSVWEMVREWIDIARANLPVQLAEVALSFSKSISLLHPASSVPKTSGTAVALAQCPGGVSLMDQIAERVQGQVQKIGVTGAFFDGDLAFLDALHKQWPTAQIIAAIDPATVYLPTARTAHARFVDARPLWPHADKASDKYLHAKAIYFMTALGDADVFVSGSANPSRPAWMGTKMSGNVEAVMVRTGPDATSAAEALGLSGMFALASLSAEELELAVARSAAEKQSTFDAVERFWAGVSSGSSVLHIFMLGTEIEVDRAILLDESRQVLATDIVAERSGTTVIVPVSIDIAPVRSCDLYFGSNRVARAMISHPHMLSAVSRSSHHEVRVALAAIDPTGENLADMINAVENALFNVSAEEEVERALKARRESTDANQTSDRPKSLEVDISDLARRGKRRRIVEPAGMDIVMLIELLTRKIGDELQTRSDMGVDSRGRTEEEQVDQDDDQDSPDVAGIPAPPSESYNELLDIDIAKRVAKKSGKLIARMLKRLQEANEASAKPRAMLQLIAVLSLVKELARIERFPRWQATHKALVPIEDRKALLDNALRLLFGSQTRWIGALCDEACEETEEAIRLRILLVWLAWNVGESLPLSLGNAFDNAEQQASLRSKALFLALMPAVAGDADACDELRTMIASTGHRNPVSAGRAENWLHRATEFGARWARELTDAPKIEVGGCCIVGRGDYPLLVMRSDGDHVALWDYGKVRSYKKSYVMAVQPH